jgi:hypothetical protein
MHVSRDGRELALRFDSGAEISVDLDRLSITGEQERALTKLVERAGDLDTTCRDGDNYCPAQAVLSQDEFEAVRGLKVGLQAIGVEATGPIIDFCLHVHIVGRAPEPAEAADG